MAPLRVSTTKSEWLPDDPTAFVPTRLWKLPFITTWADSRNQNRPTDSAEEAFSVTGDCGERIGGLPGGGHPTRVPFYPDDSGPCVQDPHGMGLEYHVPT